MNNYYSIESMLGHYGTIDMLAFLLLNKLSRSYRRLLGLPFEHAAENNYDSYFLTSKVPFFNFLKLFNCAAPLNTPLVLYGLIW